MGMGIVVFLLILHLLDQDLELCADIFVGRAHEALEEDPKCLPIIVLVLATKEDSNLACEIQVNLLLLFVGECHIHQDSSFVTQ